MMCLESSPTRTRTLNLAVNSRSLYRLSYRGIHSSEHNLAPGPTQGDSSRRKGRGELDDAGLQGMEMKASGMITNPLAIWARLAPVRLLPSRLILMPRFLVLLDGFLEDADNQCIE